MHAQWLPDTQPLKTEANLAMFFVLDMHQLAVYYTDGELISLQLEKSFKPLHFQ